MVESLVGIKVSSSRNHGWLVDTKPHNILQPFKTAQYGPTGQDCIIADKMRVSRQVKIDSMGLKFACQGGGTGTYRYASYYPSAVTRLALYSSLVPNGTKPKMELITAWQESQTESALPPAISVYFFFFSFSPGVNTFAASTRHRSQFTVYN